MAKRFSKKYGNKGWASTTCNHMSRCLSAPDALSLHHCLKNKQLKYGFVGKDPSILNYIQLKSVWLILAYDWPFPMKLEKQHLMDRKEMAYT